MSQGSRALKALGWIVGGIALIIFALLIHNEKPACGGSEMRAGDTCSHGGGKGRTVEQEKSSGSRLAIVVGVVGGVLILVGFGTAAGGRSNTEQEPEPEPGSEPIQGRSPRRVSAEWRADLAAGITAQPADRLLPPLPYLWARWAAVAAGVAAFDVNAEVTMSATTARANLRNAGGATLQLVGKRGRSAALSGGWVDARDSATDRRAVYAGAPLWVDDSVLDPRAQTNELTFCVWWESKQWENAPGSPGVNGHLSEVMPGVWSDEVLARVFAVWMGIPDKQVILPAVQRMTAAAVNRTMTRQHFLDVVGVDTTGDVDAAMEQFKLAGLIGQ